MANFRTEFHPDQDLIYGIGEWISRYILFHVYGVKKTDLDRDDRDEAHSLKENRFYAINTFNTLLTSGQQQHANYNRKRRYLEAVLESRYKPRSAAEIPTEKLKKSNKNSIQAVLPRCGLPPSTWLCLPVKLFR